MAIENILCAYSGEAARGAGLHHALKLADHHEAWLTGVVRHGRPYIAARFQGQLPSDLIETLVQKDNEHVAEIRQRFLDAAGEAGLADRTEFVDLDPSGDLSLSEFARNFDLIVTGHHQPDPAESHLSANPDMIALKSGRPVLVVPDGYDADGLAERALVAWDGKRSSARAIFDAMDVLTEKAEVTLLSVGASAPKQTERMRENLARHNVNVTTEVRPREGSVAETILAAADAHGARLIVSGAFEHSKFAHDILGGVTTELQAKSPVPIFMSH